MPNLFPRRAYSLVRETGHRSRPSVKTWRVLWRFMTRRPWGTWPGCGNEGRLGEVGLPAQDGLSPYEQASSTVQLSIHFSRRMRKLRGWTYFSNILWCSQFRGYKTVPFSQHISFLNGKMPEAWEYSLISQGYFCFEWKKKKKENVTHNFFPECVLRDLKCLVTCFKGRSKDPTVWELRYREACMLGAGEYTNVSRRLQNRNPRTSSV